MVHLNESRLITGFFLIILGIVFAVVLESTIIDANLTGTLLVIASIIPVVFSIGCLLVVTNLLNRS